MEYTQNYHLPQWNEEDRILMPDFNAAMAAIETGLTGAQGTMEALATSIGTGGKTCRILWGSYTGTGSYGAGSPNSLTFPFCPVLVAIGCTGRAGSGQWPAVLLRDCPVSGNDWMANQIMNVTWQERGVKWYNTEYSDYQCNTSGQKYFYVAFGCDLNS